MKYEEVKATIDGLHEFNPMMGHRGCRLAVSYPEIAEMQTQAVIEAAINVQKKHADWKVVPEIMIPLVGEIKELQFVKRPSSPPPTRSSRNPASTLHYKVGTMIEIPRAALTADEIAKDAEFFSFGTNDLTQMTFGFSRDDAGHFLETTTRTRSTSPIRLRSSTRSALASWCRWLPSWAARPDRTSSWGSAANTAATRAPVEFCYKTGLNYVSCSPFRVPIARLAAAQAAIKYDK